MRCFGRIASTGITTRQPARYRRRPGTPHVPGTGFRVRTPRRRSQRTGAAQQISSVGPGTTDTTPRYRPSVLPYASRLLRQHRPLKKAMWCRVIVTLRRRRPPNPDCQFGCTDRPAYQLSRSMRRANARTCGAYVGRARLSRPCTRSRARELYRMSSGPLASALTRCRKTPGSSRRCS